MNNKELHELITNSLTKDIPEDKVPRLDRFLISLWHIASQSGERKPTVSHLVEWLKYALQNDAPNFDPQWLQRMVDFAESAYEEWENTILGQISELHEFFEEVAEDEINDHYGRDGWYNFRVLNYLSNAVVGTYGGDGEDDAEPYELEDFPWQDFADFLEMGKSYN